MAELVIRLEPTAIVETGTYLGTTTEWLCSFQVPVWSCEASERSYGFSRERLKHTRNANLILEDSRVALKNIISGPLGESQGSKILFYLDAHWNEDLPLSEELEIIFKDCPRAIVLVDDFEVPDDPGYHFDDYGPGKKLNADYVAQCVKKYELAIMYPRVSSKVETGAKRGCAVFTREESMGDALRSVSLLRSFAPWDGRHRL